MNWARTARAACISSLSANPVSDPFRPLSARTVRWRHCDGHGVEHLTLEVHDRRITATSVVSFDRAGKSYGAWYQLFLDTSWHIKAISIHRTDSRWFIARSRHPGRWCDGDGSVLRIFENCVNIIFTATPFTHTPAIRRLASSSGETSESDVLFIPLDTLVPTRSRARYTCIEHGALYRVENLVNETSMDVEVDQDGLAQKTCGAFERIF